MLFPNDMHERLCESFVPRVLGPRFHAHVGLFRVVKHVQEAVLLPVRVRFALHSVSRIVPLLFAPAARLP